MSIIVDVCYTCYVDHASIIRAICAIRNNETKETIIIANVNYFTDFISL